MTPPVLAVTDLAVEFSTPAGALRAVDGVSLMLQPGERLGIVGESGSGKSVLSRTMMGLTKGRNARITGEVLLCGRSVLDLSERRRRELWGREVAMVFQDPLGSLHPITPIGAQIAEAVRRDPTVSRKEARERAVQLLDRVGIPMPARRAHARAEELSGGMRQRVMTAMAIACKPKVLIADEPTTALDVTVQSKILALFDELCAEYDIAMILVSHDLRVVRSHTDRVAVMYAGKLVEHGPVQSVFRDPMMRYTRALMDAMPKARPNSQELPRPIPGAPPSLIDPPPGCRFAPRCGHADETCHRWPPGLREVEGGIEHAYACWHPVEDTRLPTASAPLTCGDAR